MAPLAQWLARPDRPYEPASLARDGTVHCVPREEAVLAAAGRFHRGTAGTLLALVIDQSRLDAPVEWTAPAPGSPLDGTGVLFPRIRGPVARAAVVAVREIVRDAQGRALELLPRG
ncbi:DUF952 domain-containing protein [Streptomyces sp. NPDC057011]|uniref:DUF952 domain-containing protein n=1 Tax=unclassified Streptomyces TaxID=2593676 RepID=UPI0036396E87